MVDRPTPSAEPQERPHPRHTREPGYYPEDEISLVDLWRILVARRWVIAVIMLIFVAAGIGYVSIKPDIYRYGVTLEIGNVPRDQSLNAPLVEIEAPDAILARLSEAFIPDSLRSLHESGGLQDAPEVTARIPRNSRTVVIEATGTASQGPVRQSILGDVANSLVVDHQRRIRPEIERAETHVERERLQLAQLMDERFFAINRRTYESAIQMAELVLQSLEEEAKVISAEMEGEISAAQARLVDLREQEELIKERIERLNVSEKLVNDQIDEIRDLNRNALENRVRAVEQVQDPANAMTLLMIDSEIQQNRNRLANLEERLMVELPNQRNELLIRLEENRRSQITEGLRVDALKARLDQQQADNRRQQELQATELGSSKFQLERFEIEWERDRANQLQVVRELEARLEGIRETQIIAGPSRHLRAEGPGKAVILALSMVLGLMFGVFMAFFTQFLSIARREPEPEG